MIKRECFIAGLDSVSDETDLFEVLDKCVIRNGDLSKTAYICSKCAVAVTVRYPSLGSLEGLALGFENGEDCAEMPKRQKELQELQKRYPATEVI